MESKNITFLRNHRYHKNANSVFRMAQEDFDDADFESETWITRLEKFINRHRNEQVPRLKELKRYSLSDNNIKYRPAKTDEFAADNRIASDFARYITIFEQEAACRSTTYCRPRVDGHGVSDSVDSYWRR